jgi:hypothetical protein
MTQHALTLRALFFEKLASAFLTLGLPFIALALVPVLAVLVGDYGRPADVESKPPAHIENKPEGEPSSEAVSNSWNAVRASHDIDTLNSFVSKFPTSLYAEEARKRINNLEQAQTMQVADADANIQIVAQLLENKDSKPHALDEFVTSEGLKNKYPLGFAIFFSDGHKVLSSSSSEDSNISFDPSAVKLTFEHNAACLDVLPVRINGRLMTNFQNICFGGGGSVIHAVRLGNLAIDIETLGESPHGAAWVIGMRPL